MLTRRSPVLDQLAELYAESRAGATGVVAREFGVSFLRLLERAHSTSGEALDLARSDLLLAQSAGALEIIAHRRSRDWQRIRVPLACEAEFFALIGRSSPTAERKAWAKLFEQAGTWSVPEQHRVAWKKFCRSRVTKARAGAGWHPFRRRQLQRAAMQLAICAQLLAWKRPCLIRTASVQLAGSSKLLERNAATLETLLAIGSGGAVRSFADLQIEHNPATVRFHGPVRVRLRGVVTDYSHHAGESVLAESDLTALEEIDFAAPRCVTVENATKFHELCRVSSGDIFVFTSYPNKATVEFLRHIPSTIPLFHFGDTDPWGFDVLRSLRKILDREVTPLHMLYRPEADAPILQPRDRRKLDSLLKEPGVADVRAELEHLKSAGTKGDFEQESLTLTSSRFPYV